MPIEVDVTNGESIKNVLEEAINKYKRPPTTIVNCAGITRDSFLLKMDDSDFDLVLNVNLKVFAIFLYHEFPKNFVDFKLNFNNLKQNFKKKNLKLKKFKNLKKN